MANPVILSSSAANKIRTAVSTISMVGRPWGGVSSEGSSKAPIPMPFDIAINPVTVNGTTTYYPVVSLIGLWVTTGGTDIDLDTRNSNISTLVTAWNNGDDFWQLDAITLNYSLGLCFYIVARLVANPDQSQIATKPLINKFFWGISQGTTVTTAAAAVPSPASSPSSAGDVTSVVMMVPLGGINEVAPGQVHTWQSWHGSIGIPKFTDVDLVTDVQYDLTNHQLQKKTASCLLISGGLSTNWTMITGGQAEVFP